MTTVSESSTRGWAGWSFSPTLAPDGGAPAVLFCENESDLERLYGVEPITAVLDDRHPGGRQALSGLLVLCDRVALRNTLIASVQRAQVPFE